MKKLLLLVCCTFIVSQCFCWGFYGHKKINYYSVFLLPPQMMVLFKPNIDFISEHSVDPDKRRYAVEKEAARHFIDLDAYGEYPFRELPRKWEDAVKKFGEKALYEEGIVPWHVDVMLKRLTKAFRDKNFSAIMKNSTEIGHYIGDAHVPLHATKNYNGQLTGQRGIHGFWESRIPELLADKRFDFFIGKAEYIKDPANFIWDRVLESALAADSVLKFEKELSLKFPGETKYAFEKRNNVILKQYSSAYSIAFDEMLNGMVERRMRQSIYATASYWYTAWINAGQPDLSGLVGQSFSPEDIKEFEDLNTEWKSGKEKGREHED
ncbi:MAG: zinc dependent phospholipase C family protein [Ginsengibacter sp.]